MNNELRNGIRTIEKWSCVDILKAAKMSTDYDRKFDEMKKYIPFLESMIKRLESTTSSTSSNPRLAQLDKIRSLRDLLLDKKKRMKMENLLKCEQVLINLYAKVEQRDSLPGIKKKSDNIFDVESPTPKERTDLDSVRNKLKAVTKLQEEGTLPEIARANQIEENTVGKEPALFQRRPNKSPIRHAASKQVDDNVSPSYNNQASRRNYTRVLVSPESSPSRRQSTADSQNKLLFKRRSPRKSLRDYSPSYHRRDRKKSFKRDESSQKVRDLNITLNVPEDSLHSLNTEDILSRIINCSDGDVDIDTLRELRSQILGELKETGTNNDISDLLLKSCSNKKKKSIAKKRLEIEEGEISDSESEAIESIYGSLVVVDKDIKPADEYKKSEIGEEARRKIQICLVINSDKMSSDTTQPEDIVDLEFSDKEHKPLSKAKDKEISKSEMLVNDKTKSASPVQSNLDNNDLINSELVQLDSKRSSSQLSYTIPKATQDILTSIETSSKSTVNTATEKEITSDKKVILNEFEGVHDSTDSKNTSNSIQNTGQFTANFYKPLNDEESTQKKESTFINCYKKTDSMLNLQLDTDNSVGLSTSSEPATSLQRILDTEKNVDIPLLNEPSIPSKPVEKTTVSEIDILQALKNEILSEAIAIPGSETVTPPLHQPKLTKVASAKEIMPKKRISIEKYKEKSVNTTVKNMLRKESNNTSLLKVDSIKTTKIKLTEKECERFNLSSRLSLDEQLTSDDEYNSDVLIEDVYGDLAPRSPDDTSLKEMDISPPVIIPIDPVKDAVVVPKSDVDMRTLPPIISPNPSIESNSSSVTQERIKDTKTDSSQIQTKNTTTSESKKLPLDPRIRKELNKKDSPNPNLNPERTPRLTPFSNPGMTPIMTPNSRSYEMTPTHHSFEVDIPPNSKHVYAPFASSFDVYDKREQSLSRENHWEEKKTEDKDRDPRSKYLRESYQTKRNDETNYRIGPKLERYKIDRREDFRPEHSSTPGPAFGRSDNSTSFCRLDGSSTPVVGFGRSDSVTTPSHPFGRSDCPTTPTHHFGRSDCPPTPSHPFGRSDCPPTPSHPFGRNDCPTTPSHPFGRSDCPTTPSHPFGRSDCPTATSYHFGRSDCPSTPTHPFGRSDGSLTPSHPFGRNDFSMTPSHTFGRSECPTTPNHPFGRTEFHQTSNRQPLLKDPRWRGSDYDDDRESSIYNDRSFDRNNAYNPQNRYRDSDSRYYQRDGRIDREESSRYADQGRNYNRDKRFEYQGTSQRIRDSENISGNSRERNGGYSDNSKSYDDFRSIHKSREQNFSRSVRDDPRSRQRANSVGRSVYSDTRQNKLLSVQPEAGRSFKIDTSVNTTFQNFMDSKGLQMLSQSFDARRSRAASVGRSIQREPSIGRVFTPKPTSQDATYNFYKNERYRRASSVGRDLMTSKPEKSLKDLKAEFETFKSKMNYHDKKPVTATTDEKINQYQKFQRSRSRWDSNEGNKNAKHSYSPRKNSRDPRMHRERQDSYRNNNKNYGESCEKKVPGIVYSSDNIAKGTVLGCGSGVKNYKIPKLKSVIEEKEREERLKREKEEEERKEKEEKERREKEQKEKLAREKKEQEEKEKQEKEQKLRLEREKKEKEEKEKKEKLERERKEKLEREENERLERAKTEKIEKERIEKEKLEIMEREKREKADKDRKENEEREHKEKEEQERKEKEAHERKEKEEHECKKEEYRQRIEQEQECTDHEELQCKDKEEKNNKANEQEQRLKVNLNDKQESKMHKSDKVQLDQSNIAQKNKLTDDENDDLDSPTKRITRSRTEMANLDSSDEIKPKKLTKSFVFDSDSDIEDNISLKKKASTMMNSKKLTSPNKKKKSVNNKQVDFQSTFEVDELEMFGDNIASDPVIDNINDLIADLDSDIDTTKTDSADNFKNEISLENMLENITSSQDGTSNDSNKNFVNNSLEKKISGDCAVNEDNTKKAHVEHVKDVIINTENIVSTSEIPRSDIKEFTESKIDAHLDDKSHDGCSTPDSTIVSDANLEIQKESSTVKAYFNESNSDVTSTLDTVESSCKENNEPSPSRKDASSLGSIGSLLSILQDKSKIKELLTMLSETDNEKMKKKLEKLSELVSDDEDTNDGNKEKCSLQNELQIDNCIQNTASCQQKEDNSKMNLDISINNSTSSSVDKSITEERLKEVSVHNTDSKSNECILNKEDQNITVENNVEGKFKSPAIANEHLENKTNILEVNDSSQGAEEKKTGLLKKNKTAKKSKGKYVKKSVPKKTGVTKNQNVKPKRKIRNELQKLQEDIQEMFLSNDILNSTGIRMCRLAKLVDNKNVEQKDDVVFQDPKPVVVLSKYLDADKVDSIQPIKVKNKSGPKPKHKSPADTLKVKPKNIMHKPGPKSKTKSLRKEESDPYAFETDSVSESTKTKDSDSDSDTSESENCSLASSSKSVGSNEVLTEVKKKRRKRFAWQTGVIKPKHAKKKVEQKQVDHIDEELVLPQRDIAIPDPNCFVDKMYCFQKNLETYSCRLCIYTGTDIILHYKQKHPHTEIPLSRFNPKSAKEAIEQSENINFQAFSKVPSRSYTCRFCYKEFTKSKAVLETFFWHVVSMHTGEYKQACSECADSSECPFNLDIPPSPKDVKGQLIGYICEKCNFTQISLENLKTHVIVRHHDQQTVVYTINLSAMSKMKLASFIRRCNLSSPRTLRSTRSANHSTAEASDDQSDTVESESDTQTKSEKHLFASPIKLRSSSGTTTVQQIQSKITFESEDTNTNTNSDNVSVKIEEEQLNISNEVIDYNESVESDTALQDSVANRTEESDDGRFSSDITAIAHFKVSYSDTGSMEYVCCINGNDHFRTTKLISLKQHARKQHTEKWDGYCIICKVIVTPQGVHKFIDCLQHFIDVHMGEFPVMERTNTLEADQTLTPSVELPASSKPYINVRPLSDLISKPIEELLPDHSSPSPIIESVVSLTQTVEPPRTSPNYPSTSLEKIPSKAMKYEAWQALVMSKKHRVVLGTMMSKENLIKVFKCAARFCSFTSDNAEEALLHASTHQRIGGDGAMNCAYCDFDTSNNAIDLVMHVFKMHGRCQYSCALCFYRAVASQLVGAHIENAHPNCTAEGNVLRTTCITASVPEDSNVLPREKAVQHYVCAQDTGSSKAFPLLCTFRTYTPGKYCEHLVKNHKPPFVCADCKESVATAADLIIHMKDHGLMLYQCTWCVHGAEKEPDLISHVATNHPDKQPQAYIRIITSKDGSTEYRVLPLAYLNKSKVPVEDVTPSKSDDPIREANRSLELEKLIGQTTLLFDTRRSTEQEPNENVSQSLYVENEQPDTLQQLPEPIVPISVPSDLQTVVSSPSLESTPRLPTASLATDSLQSIHTSGSLPSSSVQSATKQITKSSTSLARNIKTPSLSISTTTLPVQAIPNLQNLVPGSNDVAPVIKIEPLETPNVSTDVVLSDSDEENPKSDDVISISDDEAGPVKDSHVSPETLLKCPRCKCIYTSIPAFTKHVITNGHAVGAINCPHSPCNRSMNSLSELLKHYHEDHETTKTTADKSRYNCALCGTYYDNVSKIRGHMKSVHKVYRVSCITEKPGIFICSAHKSPESAKNTDNKDCTSQEQSASDTEALFPIIETISSVQPKLSLSAQLATITPVQSLTTACTSSLESESVTTTTASLDVQSNQKTQVKVESPPSVAKIETAAANVVLSDSDEDPKNDIIDLSDDEPINAQTTVLLSQLLKCPTCHKAFRTISGLDKHIRNTNHTKFPVQCPHAPCTKTVNGLFELRIHYHADHMDRKTPVNFIFICTNCKTTSNDLDEIKQHMATIHGINEVQVKASRKKGVYEIHEKKLAVSSKKNIKEPVKEVYGPEEIDLLPIKPILDKSVRCSLCKFNTKVRLNMARHLQLHLKQQHVPQTAPVNPVPHLETNEKHFDKMLNLASSSIMTRPDKQTRPDNPPNVAVMIPPEVAAKYPKYVPERQRLTCGAKGCSYISVDEAMLKCHWDTLHSGTSDYHCVHCPPYQQLDTTRALTAPLVITHLKMHDVTLYACSACPYYHYLKSIVEKHISESHNGGNVLIVREEAPSAVPAPAPSAPTMDLKPWQCGLCKFKSMLHPKIVEHCSKQHNSKMQYKCGYCPFRTSTFENVTKHQTNSHSGKVEDVFYYYYREGLLPDDPDGTPRWLKQRQKMPDQVVKTEAPEETPSMSSDPPLAPVISSTQMTVDLNRVKKEMEEKSNVEMPIQELCKRYGEFCEPNGLKYKCSLCKVVCEDTKEAMESHLYEELQYRKWGCNLCSYKAFHLTGLNEHMAAEHRLTKLQNIIELPADMNLERWVQAYLGHQGKFIENSRKSLNDLKLAAAKAAATVAPTQKQPEPEQCQYSNEDLIKAFGGFGEASEGKYCCPKCDFVSTENDMIKVHLEEELGKIRWTCSTCSENFLTYHQAQYHCKSAHPTVHSRPNPAARQQDMRSAWINAVINTQKESMTVSDTDKSDTTDQSDNSLLVVRYEESVADQEHLQPKRKRVSSDSEDDTLVIDEPEPKKRTSKMRKCRFCNYLASNNYQIYYHELRHFDLYPYSCNYCSFSGVKQQMLNHLRINHESLPVSFKQTEVPNELPPNMLSRKRAKQDLMICLHCEGNVPVNETKTHVHENVKTEFAPLGTYVMQCSVCSLLCMNMASLSEHHNAIHPDIPMNYTLYEMGLTKGSVQCKKCNKGFKSRKDLYTHQRTEHETPNATSVVNTPEVPSPKRVARKSTSKLPKENAVAKKSTTKLPLSLENEEYSYYGTKPSMNDYENVTTLMPFCNTVMSFTIKKLNEIININPEVVVSDVTKQYNNA
ncbi:hypothetical protein K1T71_011439 [Dendrolimus kikuchii]|uniref:Uncharacterized protein n=1 Tax=Dendrolimus kikuchii TaxID=765133 RepID=A0ACC1CP03_9NEOP|nr:hypothetical protein K1T71_011439 [Dendrolimus kikuchii]